MSFLPTSPAALSREKSVGTCWERERLRQNLDAEPGILNNNEIFSEESY